MDGIVISAVIEYVPRVKRRDVLPDAIAEFTVAEQSPVNEESTSTVSTPEQYDFIAETGVFFVVPPWLTYTISVPVRGVAASFRCESFVVVVVMLDVWILNDSAPCA